MDSFWSHNVAPDSWDFLIAVYFAFGFFVARLFFDRFIFRKISVWLLRKGSAPLKLDMATLAKIVKCSESMWKLTYYAAVEACILSIGYHEPWFRDTKEYFKGWPNQELGLPLKLFYMCQLGFYSYSIAALLTWETRRKDFSVMMSHHVITVLLIGISYITSFFRIGSIILALHDGSDVFMESAKVFKYSEKELAASVFFGFFAVSWVILRLIFFPFWVISASSYDLRDCLDLSKPSPKALYYAFNTMLLTLFVFHIYWWVMICSMIRRQLNNRGKVGEDIRSGNLIRVQGTDPGLVTKATSY
ncbi:hypothetical protein ACFX13_003260 [Malus domestica]